MGVWCWGSDFRCIGSIAQRGLVAGSLAVLAACSRTPDAPPLFELLSPEATGVRFANTLPENPDFNILNYLYYFDGGGVAVGDINNDGLPDLYFTSNLQRGRLYLNKGNYKFEDVTDRAGVGENGGWATGVTMADVNGDGYVDIYVSAMNYLRMHGHNVLYVNNKDGTFTTGRRSTGSISPAIRPRPPSSTTTVTGISTCTC